MPATQVSAVMNSYMSPHGARSTASPLVVTATTCAMMPSALSVAAARTHGPASAIDRSAPAGRTGRAAAEPAGSPPPAATPGPDPVALGPDAPASDVSESDPSSTAPAEAAPTAAS